ncbi:cation-binding protein [Intrasporangium chromatireducens Q5-1]|uniref:Cation-binding protein n=1 Tax=Intrasporangium chromatireducens Q5-1 TaxID=584657 RepID=W9GG28_9MICO|nr:hemerythrin domain-containing protein [Intrasporangium chromatireducens]EWT04142.1 cation-binding protein [Intrasporangium chromatireducens Q5-1]
MDITEIIQHQHHEQRRMFAMLEEYPRDDLEGLAALWKRLEILLETHAEAEERYYYPELLKLGSGAADAASAEEEVEDAIKDHNEIRDAVRRVGQCETGSDEWWQALVDANVANSDHMAEEERQDLADFRQRASLQLRHEIAVAFLRYESLRATTGVPPEDKDPKAYVKDQKPDGTTKREQQAAAKAEKATKPGEPVSDAPSKAASSDSGEG